MVHIRVDCFLYLKLDTTYEFAKCMLIWFIRIDLTDARALERACPKNGVLA